jgi:hypothetical protein
MRDRGTESLHGVLTIEVIRPVNHYSRDVPRQDGTRLGECRLIVIPEHVAFQRGEVIRDLIAMDVLHEGMAPCGILEASPGPFWHRK